MFTRKKDKNLYWQNLNLGSDFEHAQNTLSTLLKVHSLYQNKIISLETYLEEEMRITPQVHQNIKLYSGLDSKTFAELSEFSIKEQIDEYTIFQDENPGTVFSLQKGVYNLERNKLLPRVYERIFGWEEGSLKSLYGRETTTNLRTSFPNLFKHILKENIPLVLQWIQLGETPATIVHGSELENRVKKNKLLRNTNNLQGEDF
jgi:hypothetical protein